MEKIVIVDENDKVIGYKERNSAKLENIYRVSALWIANSREEILLAQRSLNKDKHPGRWGPAVAGTVEEGEDYDDNIVKETEEEIGLAGIKPIKASKLRVRGEYNFFVQWYFLREDRAASEFKIDSKEVKRVEWFAKDGLLSRVRADPKRFIPHMEDYVEYYFRIFESYG